MLVKEVMSKTVVTIDHNKSVFQASILYKDLKVGSLIVIKNDRCVGIITERDIIERTICEKKDPTETKVSEIMTEELKTVHSLETIDKALEIMKKNSIKKLPVIVKNEIAGIITITDISKARPDLSKRFMNSWIKPEWED